MTQLYDVIVVGGGVIGCSTALHAARRGAKVLLIERSLPAEGTTSQSSSILRTHYSVPENVELARRSWAVFDDFSAYLDDDEADCGLTACGYLIVAGDGERGAAVKASLAAQRAMGIRADEIDATQARDILPLLKTDDLAVFGFEPQAGYADAYLTTTAFARAARRAGAEIRTGLTVTRLLTTGDKVTGVATAAGDFQAACVVCATNVWSAGLLQPLLADPLPLVAERHEVLALQAPRDYLPTYPVLKDMASPMMTYGRCYGRTQFLVGTGQAGTPTDPDEGQADVSTDFVIELAEQVAHRLDHFDEAGLASTWTGLYDVTPDWNPVMGPLPGWDGLIAAFGFSGHGFKLSPAVGRVLADAALGRAPEVSLHPYRYSRFSEGQLLVGRYGKGAVS